MILEGPDPEANLALAKKLAQQAVCTAGGRRPCGVCRDCVKAAGGSHPDIAVYGGKGGKPFLSRGGGPADPGLCRGNAQRGPGQGLYPGWSRPYDGAGPKRLAKGVGGAAVLRDIFADLRGGVLTAAHCPFPGADFPRPEGGQSSDGGKRGVLLAESMAKAVPSAREYDLVSKTGTLTKDKELFRAVLKELALIFRDACALVAGGESQVTASQAAGYLAQRLTRKKLMALLEAVLEAQAMLERNVNQTLLAAWMCAKLK